MQANQRQEQAYSARVGEPIAFVRAAVTVLRAFRETVTRRCPDGRWYAGTALPRNHSVQAYAVEAASASGEQPALGAIASSESDSSDSDESSAEES